MTWCDNAAHGFDLVRRRLGTENNTLNRTSLTESIACINRFFECRGDVGPPALDETGTPFQRRVWRALRAIPCGTVRSYSEIAKAVDRPSAVRAVAGACGANPVSLFTPCHRVVRANGELGGYGGGVAIKQALLDRERFSPARPQ